MKRETNNEMDLLLRRLGRRHDAAASAAGDHLDADELSAYAENVLPAAARARYSEHLAECLRCRELVVQLSSAAGVVVAHDTVKVGHPSLLKRLLASLFSPMVLRYAAPVLGLIVVGFIGLVVLRRDSGRELLTQVTRPSSAPVPAPTTQGDQHNYALRDSQTKSTSNANEETRKQEGQNKSAEPPSTPNSAPVVTVTASPEATGQKAEQSAAANEPAKEAPKPAAPTENKQQSVEVQARKEILESPTPTIQPSADKSYRAAEEREIKTMAGARARDDSSAKRAPAPGTGGVASTRGVVKLGDADDKDKKADAAETRSVAGRRFRKERGIWIDTAYDSGATTTLTRGSERYRALVADEPEIKTIADQLDGEIIVVWKGRAYRIR